MSLVRDNGEHTVLPNVTLTPPESMTEIVGGPDIYVDRLSQLQLTCRVTSGDNNPAFIIWQKENKVGASLEERANPCCQILKFDGGETSAVPYLERDGQGRHLSSLRVDDIQLGDSGEYSCQPAVGPQAAVLVHVLNRDTEVQAVLGEGEGGSNRDTEVQAVLGDGEG